MTIQELSDKFSKFTGIRKDIGALIEGASTNDEKKKVYDHLMWHLRRGRILERPWDKELFEAIVPALQEELGIESSVIEDVTEEETYTAEEAAAYNAQLPGAKTTDDWKVEPVEGVQYTEEEVLEANAALEGALEAGVALTAEQATAYNIAVTGAEKEADDELTAEEAAMYNANLVGAISTEDYKVNPVEGIKYTQEEADAYNAELDGAKHAGDAKE